MLLRVHLQTNWYELMTLEGEIKSHLRTMAWKGRVKVFRRSSTRDCSLERLRLSARFAARTFYTLVGFINTFGLHLIDPDRIGVWRFVDFSSGKLRRVYEKCRRRNQLSYLLTANKPSIESWLGGSGWGSSDIVWKKFVSKAQISINCDRLGIKLLWVKSDRDYSNSGFLSVCTLFHRNVGEFLFFVYEFNYLFVWLKNPSTQNRLRENS